MRKNILVSCFIIAVIIAIIILINLNNMKVMQAEEIEENMLETKVVSDIFGDYYEDAREKLDSLSIDEKIGQIFLVRYPNQNAIEIMKRYKFGGYILFEKDFKNKTEEEIKSEIQSLQDNSDIPLFIAVDEEGGKVVRVSSNSNLVGERFKSPSELYAIGGFEKIKEDTIQKSNVLYNLGINLNLAPVVDVSTNSVDYIYPRALGMEADLTSEYARCVINASKAGNVSYTLKHFPGYGDNIDTHKEVSIDNKSYEEFKEIHLKPFIAGINEGAEAVLVSHNIVSSIDASNASSLSKNVHELLRNNLGFTGVVITDDLDMGAVSNDEDAVVRAILAGNDLIIITDYEKSIEKVKNAIQSGRISEDIIDAISLRVIAWKYYKGMM